MPTMSLPEQPSLERLRKLARQLLNGVRAGDPRALALLGEFDAAEFTLSRAQLVLARRYGFAGWPRLRRHVELINARTWVFPSAESADPAGRYLELVCLNYADDSPARRAQARDLWTAAEKRRTRAVNSDPTQTGWGRSAAGDDLAVAAVLADTEAVRGHLTRDPGAASRATGPFGWTPLMYLAYSRPEPAPGPDDTLETARLLLTAGADPNDGRYFLGLATPFTVLTGVFASDSPDEPAHPHAAALATLLLDAGADPNDGQTLYNRMFGTADDHLELLFAYGLSQDRHGPWYQQLGDQLESPAEMLSALLDHAVSHDRRARVALLAAHGVDVLGPITARRAYNHSGRTPLEVALINGHTELAGELRGLGAREPDLDPADRFRAAVMCGVAGADPDDARRRYPGMIVWAAAQGRTRTVELLVAAGFDVNALGRSDTPGPGRWETALHAAAGNGDIEMITLLLRLGADRGLRDTRFDSTPAGWADHFGHPEVASRLQ